MKIYIASSVENAGKIREDVYIRDIFISRGFLSEIAALKDIINASEPLDVVILKSVWGYHTDYRGFLEKISILKKNNVRLINDYDLIFWNIDKCRYLEEIRHLNIIPAIRLRFDGAVTSSEFSAIIFEARNALNSDILVIKPCISENGYLTFKYDVNGNNEAVVASLMKNKHLDFIAEPYRSSISSGEISVVMIDGTPLYGIKRYPGILDDKLDPVYLKLGDVPEIALKEVALLNKFFLKRFAGAPNICRVDFLKTSASYEILEVELIDPDLYFRHIPDPIKEKAVSLLYKSIV